MDCDRKDKETIVARKLKDMYSMTLEWAVSHSKIVLGTAGVMLIVALIIFSTLGRSFLPPFNEGSFTVNISTLPGLSLDESDKIGRQAEKTLLSIPEITAVGRKTGRAELDEHCAWRKYVRDRSPFCTFRSR